MSAINRTALTSANNSNIVLQNTPESISPINNGGNVIQPLIDSTWNIADDLLTLPQKDVTKSQLATAISASALNNRTNGFSVGQILRITDRADTYPLYVQIVDANKISSNAIWVKAGKPLSVIIDYVNGYDGESNPFLSIYNENRNLFLPNAIIIADGTQSDGASLICDAAGKSSWQKKFNTSDNNSESTSLFNASSLSAMGLNCLFKNQIGKNIFCQLKGSYTVDTLGSLAIYLVTGIGSPPSMGSSGGLGLVYNLTLSPPSINKMYSFSMERIFSPINTDIWIDGAVLTTPSAKVKIENASLIVKQI